MPIKIFLSVAIAGALGSSLRYLVNFAFLRGNTSALPYATLTVNIVGCFFAGLLYSFFETKLSSYTYYAPILLVGFLGAFTTFSTFALESANFIQGNALPKALLYIALQNLAGVGAVFAGFGVVRLLPH